MIIKILIDSDPDCSWGGERNSSSSSWGNLFWPLRLHSCKILNCNIEFTPKMEMCCIKVFKSLIYLINYRKIHQFLWIKCDLLEISHMNPKEIFFELQTIIVYTRLEPFSYDTVWFTSVPLYPLSDYLRFFPL